jgi:hypothetical protein
MKVMLFLGSGVSYPSHMPSVDKITEDLLEGEWSQYNSRIYVRNRHPHPEPEEQTRYDASPEQHVLKLLANRIERYLWERKVWRKANYEDLFFVLEQLEGEDTRLVGNPVAGAFYAQVKACIDLGLDELTERRRPGSERYKLYQLCEMCQNLIACVVNVNLQTPANVVGLDFLLQVVRDPAVSEVSIVTLNHDCLIETCLEQAGISYVDGFCPSEEDCLSFDPEVLRAPSRVKLLKLHGSIDWYHAKHANGNGYVKRPSPEVLRRLGRHPVFLCGTDNKPMSYAFGLFQDLHYIWQRMLDSHDLIVMSGYGWNDVGISNRISSWLKRPGNKLVLLAQDHEELLRLENTGLALQYDDLVARDRIIPFHKWLQHTEWNSVKARLNL